MNNVEQIKFVSNYVNASTNISDLEVFVANGNLELGMDRTYRLHGLPWNVISNPS